MTTPPPPRYRVIERGRRLEVVDTWRDPAAAPPALVARRAGDGARPGAVGRTRASSREVLELKAPLPAGDVPPPGTTLRTLSLFGEKAPRVIPLDATSWRTMLTAISLATIVLVMMLSWGLAVFGLPVLGILGVALGAAGQHGRSAVTRWLDGLETRKTASYSATDQR